MEMHFGETVKAYMTQEESLQSKSTFAISKPLNTTHFRLSMFEDEKYSPQSNQRGRVDPAPSKDVRRKVTSVVKYTDVSLPDFRLFLTLWRLSGCISRRSKP